VLELKDVSLQVERESGLRLLTEVSARFPKKHFGAILGPSGCGKSTLLKAIAGLREPTEGHVEWDGIDLAVEDMDPHEIGYVPQFSIAYDLLTVWENIEAALRLRVAGLDREAAEIRVEKILHDVGLDDIEDRSVALLSGGQKRRLALALEMVSSPHLLLCDEATTGLDPKAEDEIVKLMHRLSQSDDRIVLSVTHSLRHLALYDSVLVLYQGQVAYHGAAHTLFHYFGVEQPDELFPRLAMRSSEDWHRSWLKHRGPYYSAAGLDTAAQVADDEGLEHAASPEDPEDRLEEHFEKVPEKNRAGSEASQSSDPESEPDSPRRPEPAETPSAITQFSVLLARRWKLFFRDRGALALQLALLFGFPCLVVIFALDGIPQIKTLAAPPIANLVQQMQSEFEQTAEISKTGSLVSGLIMFQVILLALMGSNNAAREIASERLIFEKEKFAGLRPGAYVASKAAFLGALVFGQSLWMGLFVNSIVRFSGDLGAQLLLLVLVNAAVTATCLGLSSIMKSAEQASLVSVYLVGFQLPLSGAVLALPAALNWITRPFIASYWGWSGFIHAMRDTRAYGAVLKVAQTNLSAVPVCVWVLCFHVLLGLMLAYTGSRNSRWE
jgi:ABC-type multidrug transport system ATPase subunit